jgi:nitrate/TMAO reductase-like tetraheme cytochrome c subunit
MAEEGREPQVQESSQGKRKKIFAFLPLWGVALLVGVVFVILGGGIFIKHGTIEAQGFCNTCHVTYYDAKEYAFNDKVGVKKPSGVLTGCAECHPQPYAEFKKSAHFETQKVERRPGCSNCHTEPHSVLNWYDYMYWQPDVWKRVQLSIRDNDVWEKEVRPHLAGMARAKFVKSDSSACRGCHNEAAKTWRTDIKMHKKALETKETCIKCHFNLVHAEVPWPDKDKK